jgi:type IV pilus assembly protein PilA
MIVVAIIALLSAVAIPSYMRYVRRSYTLEAGLNMRKLYDGAVAYFAAEHSNAKGDVLPKMFPTTAGPTPATPVAGTTPIIVPPGVWNTPGWNALDFFVTDPIRYSYSFASVGQDSAAAATMIANGDLNGNGVYSTFQRQAFGVVNGAETGVQGTAGLWISDDIE